MSGNSPFGKEWGPDSFARQGGAQPPVQKGPGKKSAETEGAPKGVPKDGPSKPNLTADTARKSGVFGFSDFMPK